MSDPYIGEIRMFAGTYNPRGWLLCQGQLIAIAQNTALFAIIGNIYGGDARTTMGVPALSGRTPTHQGLAPGLTPRILGNKYGEAFVQLNVTELPAHDHTVSPTRMPAAPTDLVPTANNNFRSVAPAIFSDNDQNLVQMDPDTLGYAGSSQGHENRQPYLAINFILNTDGLFPPRN